MGFASLNGHARTSSRKPQAQGVCDRCGRWFTLATLKWQFEYSGNQLVNLQLRVCSGCLDDPQPQLKSRSVSADPVPVRDPRPESFRADETTNITTQSGQDLVTDGGAIITIE